MKRVKEPVKTLTDRQKYLLQRIPSPYEVNGFHAPTEPKEVTRARKLTERWDKQVTLAKCRHDKKSEALIRKAKEAVYFEADTKALAIVRQVEKLLKGCSE